MLTKNKYLKNLNNSQNIAVTIGDPGGIGPEITVKAINFFWKKKIPIHFNVIGDVFALKKAASLAKIDKGYENIVSFTNLNLSNKKYSIKPSRYGGEISYRSIIKSINLFKEKKICALVTSPISKESLHLAGKKFDGHTGLLGFFLKKSNPLMALSTKKVLTVHVSTHLSLLNAIKQVKKARILEAIELSCNHLKMLGIKNPSIGVCGLNPHAGENGIFGEEEISEIIPAINQAKEKGFNVKGPISGDIIFRDALRGVYQIVIAQYHDQGHIPIKLLSFDSAINVTLGLPIIRTSVDHGTAYDIAWQNKAKFSNMICAILHAYRINKILTNK